MSDFIIAGENDGEKRAIYEKHFHNVNICYGNDGANNFERDSLVPFRITSGLANVFGTELMIHDGTIVEGGDPDKSLDLGRIVAIESQSFNQTYIADFWFGTTIFAEAIRAGSLYYRAGSIQAQVLPDVFPSIEVACNNKIWVRSKCTGASQWLDFFIELHVYPWNGD